MYTMQIEHWWQRHQQIQMRKVISICPENFHSWLDLSSLYIVSSETMRGLPNWEKFPLGLQRQANSERVTCRFVSLFWGERLKKFTSSLKRAQPVVRLHRFFVFEAKNRCEKRKLTVKHTSFPSWVVEIAGLTNCLRNSERSFSVALSNPWAYVSQCKLDN